MTATGSAALLQALEKGLASYRLGGEKKQRTGAVIQLDALIDWAKEVPDAEKLLAPSIRLFKAVVGIDTGFPDKLIKPIRVPHAPKLSAHEQGYRALVALALDLLMKSGVPKLAAAKAIQIQLKEIRGVDCPQVTEIIKWRETVMTESPRNHFGAARFERFRSQILERFEGDPRKALDYLKGRLHAGQGI